MDSVYLSQANETYDMALLGSRWQVSLIILYSSTAILSFTSNVLAICILLGHDMRTTELWKYLLNLSIADVLMALFSIPFTYTSFMLGQWIFPTWMCPVVQSAQICSVFVSVYTLTVIGFDRYFAILYPFHPLIYFKRHKAKMLILIWIVGLLFSSIQLVKTEAVPFRNGNETLYDCKELYDDVEGKHFTIFVFIITFALPVLALIFVYISIGIHIMRRSAPGNPDSVRDVHQWNLKIKAIKMLVTIVILFVLCWLPIHVHSIIVWFFPPNLTTLSAYMTYVVSSFACHWLSMAHSFLNPFIYGFMSENFKTSLRKQFFCRKNPTRLSEAELEKLSNTTNVGSKVHC